MDPEEVQAAEGDQNRSSFLDYVADPPALHEQLHLLFVVLDWGATVTKLFGCIILLLGAARFIVGFVRSEIRANGHDERMQIVNDNRLHFGRSILAGLMMLIVSDIIHTALSLRMGDLVFLAVLVAIRSTIAYFLERELRAVKEDLNK
ncbi:DUF1622 domain-containing protein [uncultured Jannaschia sp.]|uniref:DUF1622 domain-containing protein n=1 Tax=uncultured Jannaschia sp. TaxID=293347 RepID=UPI002635E75A|nr:DUF1622 domain-containing protein [uncultured Jannaschia sp.]